jgi:transcriptional regulator with XRE-family HTH domain
MMSLNDAMLKKQQEPAFAAEWDTLEPEEQIVRAIIEGREENHLTQNQLAHATGIHQTNISKLESGTANPSLRTLKRLAAGWGESSSWNSFPRSRIPTSDIL